MPRQHHHTQGGGPETPPPGPDAPPPVMPIIIAEPSPYAATLIAASMEASKHSTAVSILNRAAMVGPDDELWAGQAIAGAVANPEPNYMFETGMPPTARFTIPENSANWERQHSSELPIGLLYPRTYMLLYYRTDVLRATGAPVPSTWDELIAVAAYLNGT